LTITSRTALNDRNKAASLAEPRTHQVAPQKKALQHPWRRKNRHCSLLVYQSAHPVDKIVDLRKTCVYRSARKAAKKSDSDVADAGLAFRPCPAGDPHRIISN
jgi:hypothetical protein